MAIFAYFLLIDSDDFIYYFTKTYAFMIFAFFGIREMIVNNWLFDLKKFNSPPYFIVYFVISVTAFGSDFYGSANQRFGGPINKFVNLELKTPSSAPHYQKESKIISAKLLYQNDKNTLLIVSERAVILNNDEIRSITTAPKVKIVGDESLQRAFSRLLFINLPQHTVTPEL